jgi:hypothetical protein
MVIKGKKEIILVFSWVDGGIQRTWHKRTEKR